MLTPSVDWTSITGVLTWIAMGGGGAYLAAVLASYLVENFEWWQKLPTQIKFLSPMGFSILVSIGASILLQQTSWIEIAQPWWVIIVNATIAYIGTQKAYTSQRLGNYARKTLAKLKGK